MSAVASAAIVNGGQDSEKELNSGQSPSRFTAVNGREPPVPGTNTPTPNPRRATKDVGSCQRLGGRADMISSTARMNAREKTEVLEMTKKIGLHKDPHLNMASQASTETSENDQSQASSRILKTPTRVLASPVALVSG